MDRTAQRNADNNVMGWRMAGAVPRAASSGAWSFAAVEKPVSVCPAPKPRVRPTANSAAVKNAPRLLPIVLAATVITSLVGGVAVARYPRTRAAISASPTYPMNVAVTVQGGDSLWSIARRYGSDDRYILDSVDEIASANDLSADTALLPGQQVWIPAHTAEERTLITARRIVR